MNVYNIHCIKQQNKPKMNTFTGEIDGDVFISDSNNKLNPSSSTLHGSSEELILL